MTKPLADEALDMWQARAYTSQASLNALAVPPSHMLALVEEVRHLRDLTERLMEALRAPIGWPTTEAAMMKHAWRAGAALEALKTLEEHGVDVLLTATKHTYMMRAGIESATRVVKGATWPDALVALAQEVKR